jgi:hypothetical protein
MRGLRLHSSKTRLRKPIKQELSAEPPTSEDYVSPDVSSLRHVLRSMQHLDAEKLSDWPKFINTFCGFTPVVAFELRAFQAAIVSFLPHWYRTSVWKLLDLSGMVEIG